MTTPSDHHPANRGVAISYQPVKGVQEDLYPLSIYIRSNVRKNKNKRLIWELFIPPIYGDLGDVVLVFYPHYITFALSEYIHLYSKR